jgi:hypothetical protein
MERDREELAQLETLVSSSRVHGFTWGLVLRIQASGPNLLKAFVDGEHKVPGGGCLLAAGWCDTHLVCC